MDLESALLCPLTNASSMYYKQKLQVHNFIIYYWPDHDATLYVWHESNGNVTANKFISCIVDYISNLSTEVKKITLLLDGCNYQNRNKTLVSALCQVVKEKYIIIEQLYLCKGHKTMEADSVHFTLEKIYKPPIY